MKIKEVIRRKHSWIIWALPSALVLAVIGIYFAVGKWPSVGAKGADLLREMIGNAPVARLEMALFRVQDQVHRWKYNLGMEQPVAPWAVPTLSLVQASPSLTPMSTPMPNAQTQNSITSQTPSSGAQLGLIATSTPVVPTLTRTPWVPQQAHPLGTIQGEGTWSPYIQDMAGNVVAFRTFLQPDPQRPYGVVGVVAFDLTRTRLHYVLGYEEPYNPNAPVRTGEIPVSDLVPGRLLATFNGGFKATHGHFGAMSEGITVLPPIPGLCTVAMYTNGITRIGEWGQDITATGDFSAWRQNGPCVIHNGQINARIYSNSPKDWGYTVDHVSPTWRSGLGLSIDGTTLYYLSGPTLTMQALADSLLAAGASEALQLDINNYWVHFTAIRFDGDNLVPEPLFPNSMSENVDRYLHPYSRDFFYITGLE